MISFKVNASAQYPVYVLSDIEELLSVFPVLSGEKVAIVSDDNVMPLYGGVIEGAVKDKKTVKITVPSGEESKSPEQYIKIMERLAEEGFRRDDNIIALGGGVVGDLAGFVASTYMRGIGLYAFPTSLLAMTDSSLGGKTAINLGKGKNLCGTFYQPKGVYACIAFLDTLPEREVLCGEGEIIKYAFLSDRITLEGIKGGITETLIADCLKIKAGIVEADEKESGKRKLLNLGHTAGHAIERLSGFTLSHGECVAKGLFIALKMSRKYFGLDNAAFDKAFEIISAKGHNLDAIFSADEIISAALSDKKSFADGFDVVLINKKLKGEIVRLKGKDLGELIKWTL